MTTGEQEPPPAPEGGPVIDESLERGEAPSSGERPEPDPALSAGESRVPAEAGEATDPAQEAPSALPTTPMRLRDPAHKVCRRAIGYWTVSAVIGAVFVMGGASVGYFVFLPEKFWWATVVYVVLAVWTAVDIFIKPWWRYAVHRWEVTSSAVYTRTGWLSREQRIAPLSRVQTVDSNRSALMRVFKLASITVTTASAAGPITINGLDQEVAEQVVAELTEITSSIEGDAT